MSLYNVEVFVSMPHTHLNGKEYSNEKDERAEAWAT